MGKIILFSYKNLHLCVIAAYCSIDLSHAQPHVPEEISNCKGNLEHNGIDAIKYFHLL